MTRTAPKQKKDQLGRRLCRVPECGKIVPRGLRSYCSAQCRDDFAVRYFPDDTRRAVLARDHGICAVCGRDTMRLLRVLRHLKKLAGWEYAQSVGRSLGFPHCTDPGDVWQADHMDPVARGGWGSGIDRIRTVCTPCHRAVTAALVGQLAAERRAVVTEESNEAPRRVGHRPQDLAAGLRGPGEGGDDGPLGDGPRLVARAVPDPDRHLPAAPYRAGAGDDAEGQVPGAVEAAAGGQAVAPPSVALTCVVWPALAISPTAARYGVAIGVAHLAVVFARRAWARLSRRYRVGRRWRSASHQEGA